MNENSEFVNLDAKKRMMDENIVDLKRSQRRVPRMQALVPSTTKLPEQPQSTLPHKQRTGALHEGVFFPDKGSNTSQHNKAFDKEGPSLPVGNEVTDLDLASGYKVKPAMFYEDKGKDFCEEGKVVQASQKGFEDIVQKIKQRDLKATTGVISPEFRPVGDVYKEGIHYLVDNVIGTGSFGTVKLCIDTDNGKKFVKKEVESFHSSEVEVPSAHSHPNLTKLYGIIYRREGSRTELFIEYAGVALNRFVVEQNLNEKLIWSLARQGLEGLAYLHRFCICHLDIKPENLCVLEQMNGSLQLKITDFGSCKLPQEPLQFVGLTPEYLAPEMAKLVLLTRAFGSSGRKTDIEITPKVDVYAFGLVIMYMYKKYHILVKLVTQGKTSYQGFNPTEIQAMHQRLLISLAMSTNGQQSSVQNLVPDECDLDMRELICKLVEAQPDRRIAAKAAVNEIDLVMKRRQLAEEAREIQTPLQSLSVDLSMLMNLELPKSPGFSPGFIPDLAITAMDSESGPIKNATRDLLRTRLKHTHSAKPYGKLTASKSAVGKGLRPGEKFVPSGQGLASKHMPPESPINEVTSLMDTLTPQANILGVTENNTPVAQASGEPATPVNQPWLSERRTVFPSQASGQGMGKLYAWQKQEQASVQVDGIMDLRASKVEAAPALTVNKDRSNAEQQQEKLLAMLMNLKRQNAMNVINQAIPQLQNSLNACNPGVERMDVTEDDGEAGNVPNFGAIGM